MECVLGEIQPGSGIALRMYFRLWNHTFTEVSQSSSFSQSDRPCCLSFNIPQWCRIGPLHFLVGWLKRRLNHAFSFVSVGIVRLCACVRLLLVSTSLHAYVCRWYIIVFSFFCVGLIDFGVNFCCLYQCK